MMGQGLIQMPRPLGGAKREIGHAPEDADSGAKEEADKQRRKIQNRKNQRARRQRLKGKERGASQAAPRPFKVARWRLDELDPDVRCSGETWPASEARGEPATHVESPRVPHTWSPGSSTTTDEQAIIPFEPQATTTRHIASSAHSHNQPPATFTFPLSSDHLLHLIQYNVLRALLTNKLSLKLDVPSGDDPAACPISGQYTRHDNTTRPIIDLDDVLPLVTFPPSLAPTPLQKNHDHPIWVNAIPFPRVRDNFIRHAGLFNPWHLLYDLVGEFMSSTPAQCVASHPKPTTAAAARSALAGGPLPLEVPARISVDDDSDDGITAGRRGLIVWGEPYDARSWEVTPGFLARWAWAVEGCEEELVESSNRWRARRGEEPLRLGVVRR